MAVKLSPAKRAILWLLAGILIGSILTTGLVVIWLNANLPPMIAEVGEQEYYRGVYASCLVLSQIISGLEYSVFESYCNKLTAAGREADAYHGNTPGYQPESQERFGGMDG